MFSCCSFPLSVILTFCAFILKPETSCFRLISADEVTLYAAFQKISNSGAGDGRSPGHLPNCVTAVILYTLRVTRDFTNPRIKQNNTRTFNSDHHIITEM